MGGDCGEQRTCSLSTDKTWQNLLPRYIQTPKVHQQMTQKEIEEVAEKLYTLTESRTAWSELDTAGQYPYVKLALNLGEKKPEILGGLVSKYCVDFGMPSKYKAIVAGIISGILTALAAFGLISQNSCTRVDMTEDHAIICRGDSCIVLEPGRISYSQAQPETDVPPVVQVKPSKK